MKISGFLRRIAFVLVFVMTIEFIPVYAVEALKEMLSCGDVGELSVSASPEVTEAPSVVREVVSKREAAVKHFLMSDGSIKC